MDDPVITHEFEFKHNIQSRDGLLGYTIVQLGCMDYGKLLDYQYLSFKQPKKDNPEYKAFQQDFPKGVPGNITDFAYVFITKIGYINITHLCRIHKDLLDFNEWKRFRQRYINQLCELMEVSEDRVIMKLKHDVYMLPQLCLDLFECSKTDKVHILIYMLNLFSNC